MKSSFPLSPKYIDFINSVKDVSADFLEGTTASGKTTVGAGVKFMRMVSMSRKKIHLIAAQTVGKAEETIISQDNGILDLHADARYFGNGDSSFKIPHIKFENKVIFILGYDNKEKWKMVLGAQFGAVMLDEVNTANIDFIRELSSRNEYMLATLNPDDPSLPVYKEFINRARPYKKYKDDIPKDILNELTEEPVPGWRYWFFNFKDNASLTPKQIEKKKMSAPKGTKMYKNKILGLRGKATGLVFPNFTYEKNVVIRSDIKAKFQKKELKFLIFTAGLDTAYSTKSPDTVSMEFEGITSDRKVIILDELVMNNAGREMPFAPSDIGRRFVEFLEKNREEWGLARNVFIDSADQATIQELKKYKRMNPCVYVFNNAYKKLKIIDRINFQLGWIESGHYLVSSHCREHIHEIQNYSWNEDKDNEPEDANDHTINASQYGWIPFTDRIG